VTGWTARRFWTETSVRPEAGGFAVYLDARPVRTPLKAPLILPTEALARAVAAEWQAQAGIVDPATMPCTRAANSAIDSVARQFADVAGMLSAYGASDLLCYRADGPPDLAARQAARWDPLLDWAAAALRAPLLTTTGIMPVDQPPASLAALSAAVDGLSAFQLAAFHDLVALSGSLVLALAVTRGRLTADEAWSLSRIDEDWQIEEWGSDEEAAETAARKRADFLQADRFFALCR
jgi:chaperone required for assembly of F1-ATPase